MITDDLQDQAALYVLDSLSADETAAFEDSLRNDAELRALVFDLREAAGDLGRSVPAKRPPAELKRRVLREIALEKQARSPRSTTAAANWLPWAIAAILLVFCGMLAVDRARLRHELTDLRAADPLMQTVFFTLTPSGPTPAEAKATVAWQPGRQTGVIRITNLPAPESGKDYQLWAVDAAHKDPVSAGVVHVDKNGVAQIRFRPVEMVQQVKAFAISLEREGGVPKKEGPILLAGTA